MPWIDTIPYHESEGKLRVLYDRIKGPENNVDNIMMMHSLRPHTMEGHMAIYKHVLHHSANTVPKWFLEAIGIWVSVLNDCSYCVEHHFQGLRRLLNDDTLAEKFHVAFINKEPDAAPLTDREKAALVYARILTRYPELVNEGMVEDLRECGWHDGEILEINQVTAYFSYANRTVLGLGCSTEGDILGLSPGNSEDTQDWSHI